MDVTSLPRTRSLGARAEGALEVESFLVSQSGQIIMPDTASRRPFLRGLLPGAAVAVELLSTTGAARRFLLREGVLDPFGIGGPLTGERFQLRVELADGSVHQGEIDVRRRFGGARSSGYVEVAGLALSELVPARPPPMPEVLEAAPFLLSQSGQLIARNGEPLLPTTPSPIVALEILSSRGGTQRRFALDEGRRVGQGQGGPLPDGPFLLRLRAADGTAYQARLDVSSRAKGVKTQAYFTVAGLRFARETGEPPPPAAAEYRGLAAGGARQRDPRLGAGPAGVYFRARAPAGAE